MQEKSGQGAGMPSAQPKYEPSAHQPPQGTVQAHAMPVNYPQQQQAGSHSVVIVPAQQAIVVENINDYMGLSIFSCLCCIWPIGIIAIVMSSLVGSRQREGDIEGAKSYSRWARALALTSIICGLILIIIVISLRATVSTSSK